MPEFTEKPRKSALLRIAGPDAQANEETRADFEQRFEKRRFWPKEERAKTPNELKVIKGVVRELNDFLARYNVDPLRISAQHIHILDKTKFTAGQRERFTAAGNYSQITQRINIPDWKFVSDLDFACILAHELIHFLSFNSMRRTEKGVLTHSRRIGLDILYQRGIEQEPVLAQYFQDINEAVTEELNIRFNRRLKNIPILADAQERTELMREKHASPDIASVSVKKIETSEGDEYETTIKTFAYKESRERLHKLLDEIFTKYPERFTSRDEIFDIFARAAITGDIKGMASIVEGLGRGRLRNLAKRRAKEGSSVNA